MISKSERVIERKGLMLQPRIKTLLSINTRLKFLLAKNMAAGFKKNAALKIKSTKMSKI